MTMSEVSARPIDGASKLQETESQLRQVIETLIELGILVHDFQGTVESKEGLIERVYEDTILSTCFIINTNMNRNLMVKQLDDLNMQGHTLDEQVPMEVVE